MRVSRDGVSPVMVGRDDELGRLVRLASAAQPQVAVIAGEPGIGKTRLVVEFFARLPDGVRAWRAQADPGAFGRPYGLLLDLLDAAGSRVEPDPAAVATLTDASHGAVERLRAAVALVEESTRSAPAVLVFEDLHWADPESVALFERIADLPGPRLLIGTYRPDEVTRRHPLADALTRLERRHTVAHLRLQRLSLADTSALLEAVAGRPPSYRAALALHNRTGGNPYFLEELLRAGTENSPAGTFDVEQLCEQPLPWSLAEALRRQVDDLDHGEQRVVEAAAVLGHRVPFDLLAAVTGLAEADLIAVLRDLVRRGLMTETGDDEFTFRHALAREAVVDQLLGRERRRLHELALDTLLATADPDPAVVARHARGAGRYADLVDAARRGCARYLAMGSAHQALSLAEMGLEEAPDDRELRAGAARAAWLAGLFMDADEHARRWFALADGPEEHAAALRMLVRLAYERGKRDEIPPLIDRLCDVLCALPRGAEQAQSMAAIAQSYMLRGESDEAVAWADRTIALADELGLPEVRLAGTVEKGSALLWEAHGVDDGRKLLTEAAEEAESRGEWLLAARALNNVIDNAPPTSLTETAELLERMRTAAERAGFEQLAVAAYYQLRARLAMDKGNLAAARAALDEGRRRDRGYLQTTRGTDYHGIIVAGLALEAGDLARAEAILAGLPAASHTKYLSVPGLVFHLACRRGDVAAARAALADVFEAVERVGVPSGDYLHDLVSAGLAAGIDAAELRTLVDRGRWDRDEPGWEDLVRAQLAEADGAPADALTGYETAADSGLRPPVRGTAHAGAARCLIALGHVDRAREHVVAADGLLARWGGWRVAEVATLRGRVGLHDPAGDAPAALTPREREVAALLAEGLTNAELARRLFISPKTAAVHVSNILAKLGVASRSQVAERLSHR